MQPHHPAHIAQVSAETMAGGPESGPSSLEHEHRLRLPTPDHDNHDLQNLAS
jgi:hypothetical protein